MNNEWLKNLKVGDKVFIRGNYGRTLREVQRITPTGRIVINNSQFIDGACHLDKWSILTLEQATDEEIVKYNQTQFVKVACRALKDLNGMTYEQARQINAILQLGV